MQEQVGQRIDVCVEDETVRYLNRRDVQAALHARLVGVDKWAVCSRYWLASWLFRDSVLSTIQCLNTTYITTTFRFCYSVLEYELLNLQIPTINIVGSLVKSGIRVLVYRYSISVKLKDLRLKVLFFSVLFLNFLGITHVQDYD